MAYDLNAKEHVLKNGCEKVTSDYGNRTFTHNGKKYSGFHGGIDLVCGKNGTDYILTFEDGKVVQLRNTVSGYNEDLSAGNYIYIKHNNSYQTRYCHLKKNSICVKKGQVVKKGDVIAYMGSTGFSTGNHLHFEIRKNGKTVNPKNYLIGTNKINEKNNINSSLKYRIGDKVLFTGFLYRDSYGNGQGAYKKDLDAQISLINLGSKCPYNINNKLGWVKEENLILKSDAITNKKYYVVQKGDTLWKIAVKFYHDGNSYHLLAKANNIVDPSKILPGKKLLIP